MKFEEFFQTATITPTEPDGRRPYPYQTAFAEGDSLPELLNVPTGVGKTATAILGWLYRRRFHNENVKQMTPRRLVYCLPMRTLVKQTQECVKGWLVNLGLSEAISVYILMGGADADQWDLHPDQDAILIGTQDMLLSRALNRGYGMSRYRWPVHFGLINNDAMWVMDETQLMGVGLTTTAQLQGLRSKLSSYGITHSLWMSATLDSQPITTIDHPKPLPDWQRLKLEAEDYEDARVLRLWNAQKPCYTSAVTLTSENVQLADAVKTKGSAKSTPLLSYFGMLADEIIASHQPGTLTLVVVNRVDRAQRLSAVIKARIASGSRDIETDLIHSRFRSADRDETQRRALDEKLIPVAGRILVATQAIEAGVDISATTLFTELAFWPSLVQRFGRCNRRGVCGTDNRPPAKVVWIGIDTTDKKANELALPYTVDELITTQALLMRDRSQPVDVGPKSLSGISYTPEPSVVHTLRKKDLIELWDTTPDLAGNDLDISRFIRDPDNNDVQVYWREWDRLSFRGRPPKYPDKREQASQFPAPERTELCAVSIGGIRKFLDKLAAQKNAKQKECAWKWNPLEGEWEAVESRHVRPGMLLLLHTEASGYQAQLGWTGDISSGRVDPVKIEARVTQEVDSDDAMGKSPERLCDHLQNVAKSASDIHVKFGSSISDIPWAAIERAAWWHDVGKAHEAFQSAMHDSELVSQRDPSKQELWAKSGSNKRPNYRVGQQRRPGFRHELVSALAWLHKHADVEMADLIAYLIAAHHGKIRLSLRSLPNEVTPTDMTRRFARGVWERDPIPSVAIGNGDTSPEFPINLELMELGESKDGVPSWAARVLKLRDDPKFGPFKLAFLESLVRIADWRGSESEKKQ